MTSVTVDNTPVSENLAEGESITVPSGETWKVDISLGTDYNGTGNKEGSVVLLKNNDPILSLQFNSYEGMSPPPARMETVLEGGDTLKLTGTGNGNGGCQIGGFKL